MAPNADNRPWWRSRWFTPATALAMGAIIWAAQARGGDFKGGLVSMAIMSAYGAGLFLLSSRFDMIAVLSGRARDERYQAFDLHATAFTGVALVLIVIGLFVWDIARGRSGSPYYQLGAIGGLTYLGALLFQRFRS